MKQRITVGQLSKLTDAQKERLREWWKPQEGDWVLNHFGYEALFHVDRVTDWLMFGGYENVVKGDIDDAESINEVKSQCIPLLSIGQMIQFIQEKKPQLKSIAKNRFDKWFINIDTAQLGYKDELCDALWEATVQVLKNSE